MCDSLGPGEAYGANVALTAREADLEAFILDMMGMADTLELLAEEQARSIRGIAAEMASQIRTRAAHLLTTASVG
jgi:hypothetical protein